MTLVLIGLVGGIITGLSPCVLPVLPVVFLGGGSAGPDAEPGLTRSWRDGGPTWSSPASMLSFAVFTLFGSLILASLHLPDDAIRWLGLALLVLVGLGLLVPPLGHLLERPFYRFPQRGLRHRRQRLPPRDRPRRGLRAVRGAGARRHHRGGRDRPHRPAHGRPHPGLRRRHRDPAARLRAGRPWHDPAARGFPAPSGRLPRGQRRGDDRPGRRADVQPLRHHPARHPELHVGRGQLAGEGRRGARGRHQRVTAGLPDGGPVRRLRAREVRPRARLQRHPAVAEHPRRQAGDPGLAQGQGRPRRLLGLLLHQLPARTPARRGLVQGLRRRRARGRRRAHSRVRLRARAVQRRRPASAGSASPSLSRSTTPTTPGTPTTTSPGPRRT